MNAEVATRRLTVLHSHVLGLNRQESCASDIAMQPCAASSAIGYARPAACALPHGRVCTSEGKGRYEEAALQAAEQVLGSTLIAVKGSPAAKAPPAFAKAAGEDARMLQAVAEAHAAFERSLRSSKQQVGDATAGSAVSSSKHRGIGLRVSQAQGPGGRRPANADTQPLDQQRTTRCAHLMAALNRHPKVNALQSSTCHTLQLAVPGVRAEDLRVEVNGRQLTVSGRRPVLPAQGRAVAPAIHYTDQGLAPKQKRTSFTSTWRLPADADSRRASAELDNGMLRVSFWRNC